MALLDSIGKKITSATQNVVRGTKDFSDTTRINSLIVDEERAIAGLYSQIGKLYCETKERDASTEIGRMCLAVDAANERVSAYNAQLLEIKGIRLCAQCGAEVPVTSGFCGGCGAKMEVVQQQPSAPVQGVFCKNCGTQLPEGFLFCTVCGCKTE